MTICSDNHDEIVHQGFRCPICDMIAGFKQDLEEKDERIQELENQIDSLNETISDIQSGADK